VGLGNPGPQYQDTRHNVGFAAVDGIAAVLRLQWRTQYGAEVLVDSQSGYSIVKPMEFMNRSGQSVGKLLQYWKIDPMQMLVIHDEIDIPFGSIRFKRGGGEGGHNGLRSITAHVGTNNYLRLRVGVGRPNNLHIDVATWVLQRFSQEESSAMSQLLDRIQEAVKHLQQYGIASAQNIFNSKQE
jgi:peptidyl-tRNA hydrolase, PTH1 family